MKTLTTLYRFIQTIATGLALLATGCSQLEPPEGILPQESTPREQVIITLNSQALIETRTQLPGSDKVQHVREVQLYIFNGTSESATCIASEDVHWQQKADPATGRPTTLQRYPVKYQGFQPETDYTFVAVGMDNHAGETYGFPAALAVGTPLSQAIAVLASGKGRQDVALSELFAGATVLTTSTESTLSGNIDLYRRVAGVMGWFRNLPATVSGTPVAALRIELYKAQNKSIYLLRQTPDVIMDPIQEDAPNKLVVEIPASSFVSGGVTAKGSYILPIIAPFATQAAMEAAGYTDASLYVKDYTLRVVLVDASGNVLASKRAKMKPADLGDGGTDGGTGIIVPTDAYRFAIQVNRFYGIGSATAPIDWATTRSLTLTEELLPETSINPAF